MQRTLINSKIYNLPMVLGLKEVKFFLYTIA